MKRRQWFDWHSWVGLKLSILMSFVLITGTFATVSSEIDWLFNEAVRAQNGQPPVLDWGAMLESAAQQHPEAKIISVSAPYALWFNAQIVATDAQQNRFRIYIDPVTHSVAGTGRWNNWQRFFRQTHRHLMLPTTIGITIVGLLALPLFVTLISSLYIYKRWWRGFFRWPDSINASNSNLPLRSARLFWGSIHRLLGVWSLWFMLLMAVTGTWYLVEEWGGRASYVPIPNIDKVNSAARVDITLNALVEKAKLEFPALEISTILPGTQDDSVLLLQGQADAILVRHRANHVAISNTTGEVLDLRRGESLGLHERISEAADPLHFGTFGGAATRWLWFIFGVMLSALSISGVYLCGLRISRSVTQYKGANPLTVWRFSWERVGRLFRWPLLLLVVTAVGLAIAEFLKIQN